MQNEQQREDAAYEFRRLVRLARGEEAPRTGVGDGVAALQAALAVNRSLREGQPVQVTG